MKTNSEINCIMQNLTSVMFKIATEILFVVQAECVKTGATKETCYIVTKNTLVDKFNFPIETADFIINKIIELMNNIENMKNSLSLQSLIDFGFKHIETKHIEESNIDRHYLSKLISNSKIPPFYIKMVSIDATNGVLWQLLKDNVIIAIISNIDELKKAIFVITSFSYDNFK